MKGFFFYDRKGSIINHYVQEIKKACMHTYCTVDEKAISKKQLKLQMIRLKKNLVIIQHRNCVHAL